MNSITFLGTGGARVLVSKQLLASGGLWVEMGNTRLHVDPGPGALVQATRQRLDPTTLDAILLSHPHLDHASDVNAMIEAMTEGGFRPRGAVIAPRDSYERDPVVLRYVREYVREVSTWEPAGCRSVGDVRICTPVRHDHSVETYGMVFEGAGSRWSYIADTRYFPELAAHYRAPVVVMNVVLLVSKDHIQHLSVPDAKRLIEEIRPETAIITHFGMTVLRARPEEIADRLSKETGVRVIAATDGMRFELPVTLEGGQAKSAG